MFLAFPEYVGGEDYWMEHYKGFSDFDVLLACPVVFYSASDYYKSAWYG
jgi:Cu+-exporting ATPase